MLGIRKYWQTVVLLCMVPPFATMHTFCLSEDGLRNPSLLKTLRIQRYFARLMTVKEKKILAERKTGGGGVTTVFFIR